MTSAFGATSSYVRELQLHPKSTWYSSLFSPARLDEVPRMIAKTRQVSIERYERPA